jgi:site-specific DNA recombinase
VKVALYARVSSDVQAQKGTIASQLEALKARMAELGHEVAGVYRDDGYSGARLERPGLDALRDAAMAGAFEAVWCLSPDRLARNFAYQVLVTDELARFGVEVCYVDSPPLDDPQARLLVQVQGLFAEYEKAKLSERARRGKIFRVRAGEAVFPRVAYGYRRVPRSAGSPARLEVYEPEAAVVRRIFDEYTSGASMRQVVRHLYEDGIGSPDGKDLWPVATIGHLLRNRAYAGTATWYRYDYVPTPGLKKPRKVRRPPEAWVEVPVPAIVSAEVFAAAQAVTHDNSRFSARNTTPGTFLLRGLVVCGPCGRHLFCDQKNPRKSNGTKTRYYGCPNHDPIKAGGPERRCQERLVRADELDAFVFGKLQEALLSPELLMAGEAALAGRDAPSDDQLLAAQVERIGRQLEATASERRRLADLYQAGLVALPDLQRRAAEVASRREQLEAQQAELQRRHQELAGQNRLRRRIADFAARVAEGFEQLGFDQRQRLVRLVVEEVRVTGWRVELHLRVPLDDTPPDGGGNPPIKPSSPSLGPKNHSRGRQRDHVSSHDGLRPTYVVCLALL